MSHAREGKAKLIYALFDDPKDDSQVAVEVKVKGKVYHGYLPKKVNKYYSSFNEEY